ncbi:hypothetical protein [Intestinirhabdus alba]|jgi:hypothetical protein|nr:hypothetical protein [Intestinirhabdus alba]
MTRIKWFVLIFSLAVCSCGGYYMWQQQYQMYVLVTPDSEDDPEWPSKKKWFDASEWLKTSQYIKIDDAHLINKEYAPVDNLNDFSIMLKVQEVIKDSVRQEPNLINLARIDEQDFFHLMKDGFTYEYLRTRFDQRTLKPIVDYFLILFSYNGVDYEVELLRTPYKEGYSFSCAGVVHKAGYWHGVSPAGYSWREYLAGQSSGDVTGEER